MGYDIRIGEKMRGVLDPEIGEQTYVEAIFIPGSPSVVNTTLHTASSNVVFTSYSGPQYVIENTEIEKYVRFAHIEQPVTEEMERGLAACIAAYQGDRQGYSFSLLQWMHWWVTYSLDNCSNPVIIMN
jgi:hypothetical protein